MDIVNRMTSNLKICLKNKIEEQALENIIYAKLAHLFALKNIKFISVNNLQKPAYLSYYAVNFVTSGGEKNQSIKHIDNYLIPFLKDEEYKINKRIRDKVLNDEISLLDANAKNYDSEKLKLQRKYADAQLVSFKTNGGTPASLYDKLERISKYKMGAVFAQITEFSDYFRGSVENNLSANKGFLDLLNNLYDGLLEPSDSLGTERKELNDVPFNLLFLSDIEDLLEPKNNKIFKTRLKSGYARRINFYINKEVNYAKNPPERPTIEQKKEAYANLKYISSELKQIYDNLPMGAEFEFTDEANHIIEAWEDSCAIEVSKFYKYSDLLSLDDKIKEIELSNSAWKIIKMSVIIQILMNKKTYAVGEDAVLYAIEFYKKCRNCLYSILAEKQITEEENLFNFFINNQDIYFNKTDIKRQNFVSRDNFARWFDVAIKEVAGLLEDRGYQLRVSKRNRNEQKYICIKLKQAEDDLINVSILPSNDEKQAKGYEFKKLTTFEFLQNITQNYSFVAGEMQNGHRKKSNYIGNQNTIWLDFDEGLTLEEAQQIFKDYWYIIYTSRNHQKTKHDVKCDRFRLILKINGYMPTNNDDYSTIMHNIAIKYGSDIKCSDCSRFYFGNKNAEVITNNGNYFDIEPFKDNNNVAAAEVETEPYDAWGCDVKFLTDDTINTQVGDNILKTAEIYKGNRDFALNNAVCILINAVKEGKLSHQTAINWLNNQLRRVTTPDFVSNANKFMRRLQLLEVN